MRIQDAYVNHTLHCIIHGYQLILFRTLWGERRYGLMTPLVRTAQVEESSPLYSYMLGETMIY